MKKSIQADLLLVLVTFFWGTTYALTKMALGTIEPLNLISLRFLIAFFVAGIFFWKKIKTSNRQEILYAMLLSGVLFLTFVAMTFGLKYTSASNAAFLAGLTVIFIAIFSLVFLGKKLDGKSWFCVLLALLGVSLLTLTPDIRINMGKGDFLSIMVSVLYAVYVLMLDRFTDKVDPLRLGVLQLGFVGLYSTAASLFFENYTLPQSQNSWIMILILAVFCTAVAYIAQSYAQKYTDPTHTGIILSLETVFSGIFAYILLGELLRPLNYFGALLLIASTIIMELDFKKIGGKYESNA